MIDIKIKTLLAVSEYKNFTRAAEALALTQPAVSQHIRQLEKELGVKIFNRKKGSIMLTNEGEIVLKYAKRMKSIEEKMFSEIANSKKHISKLRVGVTPTSESNVIIETLALCINEKTGISITIISDTIKNLYTMLDNFEIDIAIVQGKNINPSFNSMMLDTDYLVCVMSNNNQLAKQSMLTLNDLKKQKLILRLPSSATRELFTSTLESINENIDSFNVVMEVDNIATIKYLVRKNLGVSILAKSACMNELSKKKITVLPIENLSMVRETNLVYHKTFSHTDVLELISKKYNEISREYIGV